MAVIGFLGLFLGFCGLIDLIWDKISPSSRPLQEREFYFYYPGMDNINVEAIDMEEKIRKSKEEEDARNSN